jgi:hypothetical protein
MKPLAVDDVIVIIEIGSNVMNLDLKMSEEDKNGENMKLFTKPVSNIVLSIAVLFLCGIMPMPLVAADYVADHTVAKESVLRSIPEQYITSAKENLHIMYCGTSHSSQVRDGMRQLQYYKSGDDTLYAVTFDGNKVDGALDIDYRPRSPVDVYNGARDLSHDSIVDGDGHTNYYLETVEYLDHADHRHVNVVMWSWCSIEGHDVQIYLDNFDELIEMYRAGGSKGRTSDNAVTFVWMTGYARGSAGINSTPTTSPYNNHRAIVDHCRQNGYFCIDYWSHDTHDYETDELYPYAQGNSPTHLLDWMNAHPGEWYECSPAHASQYHLLGNRRAYAAWWVWARLAGWQEDGDDTPLRPIGLRITQ